MVKRKNGGEQVKSVSKERDATYVAIGSRIKQIRKSKGMTQATLAHIVGVANSHMSHIESAQSNASLKTIMKIANALSVGVDELLCDGLESGKLVYQARLDHILADCTVIEAKAILEIVTVAKESIRNASKQNMENSDKASST